MVAKKVVKKSSTSEDEPYDPNNLGDIWNKIWNEQNDWLSEREKALDEKLSEMQSKLYRQYYARLGKAFKAAAKTVEDTETLWEINKDFESWMDVQDAKEQRVVDKALATFRKSERAAARQKEKTKKEKAKAAAAKK